MTTVADLYHVIHIILYYGAIVLVPLFLLDIHNHLIKEFDTDDIEGDDQEPQEDTPPRLLLTKTQANILIATEILGWKIDNSFPDKGRVYRSPGGALEMDTTFKFDSDYNALMKAWDRIEHMGYSTDVVKERNAKRWLASVDLGINVHGLPMSAHSFGNISRIDSIFWATARFAEWSSLGRPNNY
jgi:hypothetical protein